MPYSRLRYRDHEELAELRKVKDEDLFKVKFYVDGKQAPEPSSRQSDNIPNNHARSYLNPKVISRVFPEDYHRVKTRILDPRGSAIRYWNKVFLAACLISLFVDPFFFYLTSVNNNNVCTDVGFNFEVVLTIIRSIADVFYLIQIYVRFHTAYVAPSPRVLARGELVIDPYKIAKKYLFGGLWIDLIAALPLPQLFIWLIIPSLSSQPTANTKNVLWFIIIFFQYLPRLYLISPQTSQIAEVAGVVTKTAWVGAAYNLAFFMMGSHVIGACYYLLSIERQEACWRSVCHMEDPTCEDNFFDCQRINYYRRRAWFQSSNVTNQCVPTSSYYDFGIYGAALGLDIASVSFPNKYFYCFWFGLQQIVSLGQNLRTSPYVSENIFSMIVGILGLLLFALIVGNMQTYLQSTTVRLEEWRVNKSDIEQWMHLRRLPPELRQAVRTYDQSKWVATQGVDEESLLKGLPVDLRRDIKRHLCYDLVRQVPLFDQMDERVLDAICERLRPALCTQGTCPIREGDPVNQMLFIIRGNFDSFTTNGGRTGFFNSCRIGPGDFCGEELVTWALDPYPSVILPSSTRTIKAISEVEAFALKPEDLKFVSSQFRRLHSTKLKHKFRFYSHQWRTWAACFVQAAWRRYKRRKNESEFEARESYTSASASSLYLGLGARSRKMEDIIAAWKSSAGSPRKPAEPHLCVD